ncbi:hypothetical protein AK812_SmicGene21632 [Symbiodinium microadriaticum]|uniref:Uncharacterized protein n=1 Tax=Symbiodinium microadriaticum TaxID=2951 RepID=A0A1Q9DLY1_SYMMI|nr:hypothetical protein AK812_SmicGene21632 [Symbiodinium microadriaticum]
MDASSDFVRFPECPDKTASYERGHRKGLQISQDYVFDEAKRRTFTSASAILLLPAHRLHDCMLRSLFYPQACGGKLSRDYLLDFDVIGDSGPSVHLAALSSCRLGWWQRLREHSCSFETALDSSAGRIDEGAPDRAAVGAGSNVVVFEAILGILVVL